MEEILSKAKNQIDSFQTDSVTVTPGYEFRQPEILRKIDLYYASKFFRDNFGTEISGNRAGSATLSTRQRFKRIFFNIVKSRVNTATKAIDLDTKDIRVIAEDGQSFFPAWFFERELKQYMKEENFGELLNEIVSRGPRYGSVVIKNVDGDPKMVQLRNLALDPSVDCIKKSPFVAEYHLFTIDELRENGKNKGWENVEEVIKLYHEANQELINVVEYYGYAEEREFIEDGSDEIVRGTMLIAGMEFFQEDRGSKVSNVRGRRFQPIVLHRDTVDEWPYRDWHWEKEEGRWLGVGIVEDLFHNQEFENEVTNIERKNLYWSSKKIWQTADKNAPKNLFTHIENGVVLTANSPIAPVAMEERNLPEFNALVARIEKNSDERSFSFDVNTGQSLPSGTPFRLGAILANAVNSHYAFKRESLGLFIRDIIIDFIVPQFKKNKSKAHILNFTSDSDEIEKLDELVINATMQRTIEQFEKETGKLPSVAQYDKEREKLLSQLSTRRERFLELSDNFYDTLKFRIDIVITNEQVDVQSEVQTLTSLYQIQANQGDPQAKKTLEMIMNAVGKSPIGLFSTQEPAQPQLQVTGGTPPQSLGQVGVQAGGGPPV